MEPGVGTRIFLDYFARHGLPLMPSICVRMGTVRDGKNCAVGDEPVTFDSKAFATPAEHQPQ